MFEEADRVDVDANGIRSVMARFWVEGAAHLPEERYCAELPKYIRFGYWEDLGRKEILGTSV